MNFPRLFGSYLLHHQLAEGTTSEVFLAQTLGDFSRLCAIKRIRPGLAAMPDFSRRFRDDASMLVRLIHSNVVQVLEVGAIDDTPFIAMEPISGVHVSDLLELKNGGNLIPLEMVLYTALQACEGATYLYQRRKEQLTHAPPFSYDQAWPNELMFSFDGAIKTIDLGSFGALRLGQQKISDLFRSPGYTPPEVILKQAIDQRTDIFTIGLLIWELLSGGRLIADDPEQYIRNVLNGQWEAEPIERTDIPNEIVSLVRQMLQRDPDQRPHHYEQVREVLAKQLRLIAPAYGTIDLAIFLRRNFKTKIERERQLSQQIVDRKRSWQLTTAPVNTESFGNAETVVRHPVTATLLNTGDRIPGTRYRVIRSIGRGGSAEVFAAQHIDLDKQVAIKILSPELATQSSSIAQFRLEARICSRVGHSNIVDVIDFGELDDGRFFFAMELLDGENLGQHIGRNCPLDPEFAIEIFLQIADALQAAHDHSIIHRDIKPENIILLKQADGSPLVKVLDFGVMAFANDPCTERVGTPGYMPPEQVFGAKPTVAMDIYGFGATLYEALCGDLPYAGDSLQTYAKHQGDGPAPTLRSHKHAQDIDPLLERTVMRALERDPHLRQRSMKELTEELLRAQASYRGERASTTQDTTPVKSSVRIVGRSVHTRVVSGIATIAVIALAAFVLWSHLVASIKPDAITIRDTLAEKPEHSAESRKPQSRKPANTLPVRDPAVTLPAVTLPASIATLHPPTPAQNPTDRVSEPEPVESAAPIAPALHDPRKEELQALLAEANRYLAAAQFTLAEQHFTAAAKLKPKSADAHYGLASVAFERAQYTKAIGYARVALAINSRDLKIHLLLGDAYYALSKYRLADHSWRTVIAHDPQNEIALRRIEKLNHRLN